jgi:hypothetical protein
MQSVIVITKDPIDLDHIAPSFEGPENRLVVDGPDGLFAFIISESLINSFDEDELQVLRRSFSTFFLALLEFRTIDAVNIAIAHIDIPADSLVDNDHGLVTTIGEIRNLIRESVAWTTLRPGKDSEQSENGT